MLHAGARTLGCRTLGRRTLGYRTPTARQPVAVRIERAIHRSGDTNSSRSTGLGVMNRLTTQCRFRAPLRRDPADRLPDGVRVYAESLCRSLAFRPCRHPCPVRKVGATARSFRAAGGDRSIEAISQNLRTKSRSFLGLVPVIPTAGNPAANECRTWHTLRSIFRDVRQPLPMRLPATPFTNRRRNKDLPYSFGDVCLASRALSATSPRFWSNSFSRAFQSFRFQSSR